MANREHIESLGGVVTPFGGNGRKLGYPTANIKIQTTQKDGIYFGFATLDKYKNQPALIFIGTPTTVGDSTRRVEAHLLDIADKDYYGLRLQLSISYFHRPPKTFKTVDDLLKAIKADERSAREWFRSQK